MSWDFSYLWTSNKKLCSYRNDVTEFFVHIISIEILFIDFFKRYFMQRVGVHNALQQYLKILKTHQNISWPYLEILKTNYNVSWLYLEILKTNQRSITIFGITHHVNIKQFEYFLEPLVRTKQKLKNTRVLLKWTKND